MGLDFDSYMYALTFKKVKYIIVIFFYSQLAEIKKRHRLLTQSGEYSPLDHQLVSWILDTQKSAKKIDHLEVPSFLTEEENTVLRKMQKLNDKKLIKKIDTEADDNNDNDDSDSLCFINSLLYSFHVKVTIIQG